MMFSHCEINSMKLYIPKKLAGGKKIPDPN